MELHKVTDYMACATSAMREAVNGQQVLDNIREETGLTIHIIDGKTEAQILYSTQIAATLEKDRHYLYMDVGGGSTEISSLKGKKIIDSEKAEESRGGKREERAG